MAKYDIIIIGSGLGGLQCAYILAKQGLNVCVSEKNTQAGGCLQTFRRGKHTFDTGFHYVGGLDEGQPLRRFFDYFRLTDLPLHRLDKNGFDEVIFDNRHFMFVNGYECFVDKMTEYFPHERAGLKKYADFLNRISDNIFLSLTKKNDTKTTELLSISTFDYLQSLTDNQLLMNILSGTSLKADLNPKTLPLYIFAQINSSYIQSAWRLKGGGPQITNTLIQNIKNQGGTVLTESAVTRLVEKGSKLIAAEINGSEQIEAERFISDIHPSNLMDLIADSPNIRKSYRNRIKNLKNSFGMFTAHLALKENSTPYLNRNLYIYENGDVWQNEKNRQSKRALITFKVPDDNSLYTKNIDIMTPLAWESVEPWENTVSGKRGDDYKDFKKRMANECIALASRYIPDLKDKITNVYASTPLTYRDYTGTPFGSAYGINKDCNNLISTLLSPKTSIPNLFLTGQNLNFHGILGVSVTSFLTCAEIIGQEKAIEGLI